MKGGFPIIKYKGGTMDMEYDIGSKIKAARLKKKMTQEQVAELLGVSRQIGKMKNPIQISSVSLK